MSRGKLNFNLAPILLILTPCGKESAIANHTKGLNPMPKGGRVFYTSQEMTSKKSLTDVQAIITDMKNTCAKCKDKAKDVVAEETVTLRIHDFEVYYMRPKVPLLGRKDFYLVREVSSNENVVTIQSRLPRTVEIKIIKGGDKTPDGTLADKKHDPSFNIQFITRYTLTPIGKTTRGRLEISGEMSRFRPSSPFVGGAIKKSLRKSTTISLDNLR